MLATDAPTQESLFQAKFQYIAHTCIQTHAVSAQRALQESTQTQAQSCYSADFSMVTKVGNESRLTNPHFRIEGCLDSLYSFAI